MHKILPFLLLGFTLLFSAQTATVTGLDPNGDGFLSIRTKPKGLEIGKLYNGDKVKILGERGKWYKVENTSTGQIGWSHGNWIRKIHTSNTSSSHKKGKVYGLDSNGDGFLSLRNKPKGREIGKLYNGDNVDILASRGKWYKVKLADSGKVGWAHGNWVRVGFKTTPTGSYKKINKKPNLELELNKSEQLYQLQLLKKQQIPQDIIVQYFNILNNKSYKKNPNIVIKLPKIITGKNFKPTFEIKNTSKNNKLYIFMPSLRNPFIIKIEDLKHTNAQYSFTITDSCNNVSEIEIYAILKDDNNQITINKAKVGKAIGNSVDRSVQCASYYNMPNDKEMLKSINKVLSNQNSNISFNNKITIKFSKDGAKMLFKSKSRHAKSKEYIEQAIVQEDKEDSILLKFSENIKQLYFKLPKSPSAKNINIKFKYTDGKELFVSSENNETVRKKITKQISARSKNNHLKDISKNTLKAVEYLGSIDVEFDDMALSKDNKFLYGLMMFDSSYRKGQKAGLYIIDISSKPKIVSQLPLGTSGNSLFVPKDKNHLYIMVSNGISIIDVSNPMEPRKINFIKLPTDYNTILSKNEKYVYQATGREVSIYEISNLKTAKQVATYSTTSFIEVISLSKDETKLCIGTNEELKILDIHNINNIIEIGQYKTTSGIADIEITKNKIYIATLRNLLILDAHNPSNIKKLGEYPMSIQNIVLSNDELEIFTDKGEVFNISDEEKPFLVATYDTNGFDLRSTILSKDNNMVFITSFSVGMTKIAINNSKHGYYKVNDTPRKIVISKDNKLAYVANNDNGLIVLDVENPLHILKVGQYESENLMDIVLSNDGNKAYIENGDLEILDVANIHSIETIGSRDIDNGGKYLLSSNSNRLYTYDDYGLSIYNIKNPSNVIGTGEYSPKDTYVTDITLSNDDTKIYLATAEGLEIIDVTSDIPKKISFFKGNEYIFDKIVFSSENALLYGIHYDGSISIFDIKDVQHPKKISKYQTAIKSSIVDMILSKNDQKLYLLGSKNIVSVIDILNPQSPVLLYNYYTADKGTCLSLSHDGKFLYVGEENFIEVFSEPQ